MYLALCVAALATRRTAWLGACRRLFCALQPAGRQSLVAHQVPGRPLTWSDVAPRAFLQVVKGQLFGMAMSLVKAFGVVGGTSRVLGIMSAAVARLGMTKSE